MLAAMAAFKENLLKMRRPMMLVTLVLMFVLVAAAPRIFITIPAGHAGVLWLRLFGGTVTTRAALGEGLHIVFPWDKIFIYDMRTRARHRAYEVISKDGLHFDLDITVRWHPLSETLARLHKEFGPDYPQVLLLPTVGSVARRRIAQYDVESVYSVDRNKLQREIVDDLVGNARAYAIGAVGADDPNAYVTLVDLLITRITLPERIRTAISGKIEQLIISEEYLHRLETERLEAQRKQIEARGIQIFQQTVQAGITDSYLRWRGIEATLKLATSTNAKVVIIGNGREGLPLILNTADSPQAVAPAAAASIQVEPPVSPLPAPSGGAPSFTNAPPPPIRPLPRAAPPAR
jgi:regulator of protease activity HflC (stomatin/prohibitin superfamily)